MSPTRNLVMILVLAAMVTAATPRPVVAGQPIRTSYTQTLRSLSQDQVGIRGEYLVSYSALSLRTDDWSLRGSLSWLSWTDGGSSVSVPDGAGLGSFYLTAGRRLWTSHAGTAASSGWLRLRGKLPLQAHFDVTGSGEADWGASLFTSQRIGPVSVLAEAGFTELGEPTGFNYDALASASVSISYRKYGDRFYPILGYSTSSPARSGDPSYGEWSVGGGALISRKVSFSILYTRGTTVISPEHGLAVSASLRL